MPSTKRRTKAKKKADFDASLLRAVNAVLAEQQRVLREFRYRLFAIQELLHEHGVVDAREVEQRSEELQKRFQPTEEAFLDEMRRILEKYDGPKQ